MSFTATQGFSKNIKGVTAAAAATESGAGGGIMAIWTQDRVPKLTSLLAVQADNQSSFPLPAGLVDTQGFSAFDANEQPNGYGLDGQVLAPDDTPLSGTGIIERDGAAVATQSIRATFLMAAPPPAGIETGVDAGPLGTYTWAFQPDLDGLEATVDPMTLVDDHQPTIVYGEITGTVTDVNGNPVSGVAVTGAGAGTSTGGQGTYSLFGPGGTTVTLESLDGFQKQATLNAGQQTVVDWQYAGVEVTVELPGGFKAQQAPVTLSITNQAEKTQSNGRVTFAAVPLNRSGRITVFNRTERAADTAGEGSLTRLTVTAGAGIRGGITTESGEPILGVDVHLAGDTEADTESAGDGTYQVGTGETGDLVLIIARDDRRFDQVNVDLTFAQGELKAESVQLRPKETIGKAV